VIDLASPLNDKVLPAVIFLIGLMTVFILIVISMNPTIESNLQATHNAPSALDAPDYEKMLLTNLTYSWSSPNPFEVTPSDRTIDYPALSNSERAVQFTNPGEASHPISMWVIGKHLFDYGGDRYELFFKQSGGTLGLKTYYCFVDQNSWTILSLSNATTVAALAVNIELRHTYIVIVTPGPGYTDATTSFMDYNFNVSIGYKVGNQSTDPWVIASQLFTFSLPGVPVFLTALIMTPIWASVGIVAYIVIRGALPF